MRSIQHALEDPQAPSLSALPACFNGVSVTATCDTAIGLMHSYNVGLKLALDKLTTKPRDLITERISEYYWKYHFTRPPLAALVLLGEHCIYLNRFDIALDFAFPSYAAMEQARLWLMERLHLNWKNTKKFLYVGGDGSETLYLEDTSDGAKPSRTLTMYANFRKKNTLRLELRFQSTATVRANGLDDWKSEALTAINPRDHFKKHMKLQELDTVALGEAVRQALNHRRYRHLSHTQRALRATRMINRHKVANGITQLMPMKKRSVEALQATEALLALVPEVLSW